MEARVIVATELQLKAIVADAVIAAFKYHQPAPQPAPTTVGDKVDFSGLRNEYYPGIPESTVRQDTAHLSRTKVGKRILFDRTEIEAHLRGKRRSSATELAANAETQFVHQQQRKGGRKTA